MAQPYKSALLNQLGVNPDEQDQQPTGATMIGQEIAGPPIQNTGVAGPLAASNGGFGAGKLGGGALAPTGGDAMGIASSYDMTGASSDQRNAFQKATQEAIQRDTAGNQADMDFLAKNGGQWGNRQQYRPGAMPNAGDFGGVSEGGSLVPPMSPEGQGPSATAPTTPAGDGYKPPFLLGFETSKLNDPSSGSAAGSKYTPAAKAFGQAYLAGAANISRGNLQPAIAAVKDKFPNAKAVGDDKIDFGDGNGPIDVIWNDNGTDRVVFQNTTGHGPWEQKYGGGGGGSSDGGGAPAVGGGGLPAGHAGGFALDSALTGDPIAKIQQLISQMSGSRPNFAALMQQLGGG